MTQDELDLDIETSKTIRRTRSGPQKPVSDAMARSLASEVEHGKEAWLTYEADMKKVLGEIRKDRLPVRVSYHSELHSYKIQQTQ